MTDYVVRRLLWMIPSLIAVLTILFILMHLVPGDPIRAALGSETGLSEVRYQQLRREYGLDRPILVQFGNWVWNAVRLDFGRSLHTGNDVWAEIRPRIPITFSLVFMALAISIVIAVPLGSLVALYPDKWLDVVVRVLAILGFSLPSFWQAIMILLAAMILFRWFPPVGYSTFDRPLEMLQQLLLPALVLATRPLGVGLRMTRSTMLEVLAQEYIRTANAKGLTQRLVVARHALPNTLLPVLTFFGLETFILISGTVVIEQVFGISGIGGLTVLAARQRDYFVVQACVLILVVLALVINLIVDLLYAVVDPRVRYATK